MELRLSCINPSICASFTDLTMILRLPGWSKNNVTPLLMNWAYITLTQPCEDKYTTLYKNLQAELCW